MPDDDDERGKVVGILRNGLGPASNDQGGNTSDASRASGRRIDAVSLRLAGMTYAQIAEHAGYSHASAARQSVLRALEKVEAEQVADLRMLENARLDRMLAAVWPTVVARAEEVLLEDRLRAVDRALRISERRARLNGLDAPVQVALTPTSAEVMAWVAQVMAAADPGGVAAVVEPDVVDVDWVEQPEDQ